MIPSLFMQGIIIGFSIAAPVGPIGVLCIRRTLAHGTLIGIISGLGAATADAVYGLIAGFGLTAISNFLIKYTLALNLCGALFLGYLGIKTFLAPANKKTIDDQSKGNIQAFLSTFFLTITNPMTIISFGAIMASTGIIATTNDYRAAIILVMGVFLGSMLWWLILCGSTGALRAKVNDERLVFINKIAGLIILGFAIYLLTKSLI